MIVCVLICMRGFLKGSFSVLDKTKYIFKDVKDYCNTDERDLTDKVVLIDKLKTDLKHAKKEEKIFLVGFTTILKLSGIKAVEEWVNDMLTIQSPAHIVILCYQCYKYFPADNPKTRRQFYRGIEGEETPITLIFSKYNDTGITQINGIHNISSKIEEGKESKIYVLTNKLDSFIFRSVWLQKHRGWNLS